MVKKTPVYDTHWVYLVYTKPASSEQSDVIVFGSQAAALEAIEMIQSHKNKKVYYQKVKYFYDRATMRDLVENFKIVS